jgi:hypothetical protein
LLARDEAAAQLVAACTAVAAQADRVGSDELLTTDELDEYADAIIASLGTAIAAHQDYLADLGIAQRKTNEYFRPGRR